MARLSTAGDLPWGDTLSPERFRAFVEHLVREFPLPAAVVELTHQRPRLTDANDAWNADSGCTAEAATGGAPGFPDPFQRVDIPGLKPRSTLVWRPAPSVDYQVVRAARRWGLTRRQEEVLSYLVWGHSNREIGAVLGCAVGTVELHVGAILAKSGAESRTGLVTMVFVPCASEQLLRP